MLLCCSPPDIYLCGYASCNVPELPALFPASFATVLYEGQHIYIHSVIQPWAYVMNQSLAVAAGTTLPYMQPLNCLCK